MGVCVMWKMKKIIVLTSILSIVFSIGLSGSIFAEDKKEYKVILPEGKEINLPSDKIAEDLRILMEKSLEDEAIPVYVWLKDIDNNKVKEGLKKIKGMDPDIYDNPELFETEIASKIKDNLQKQNKSDTDKSKTEKLVNEAVSSEVDRYIKAKREITKEEYSLNNNKFLNDYYKNNKRKVFYNSGYSSTLALELTAKEIAKIVKDDRVEGLSLYEELVPKPELSNVLTQIQADSTGTKSSFFNHYSGLYGDNIVIGIIEADSGRYDSSNPHLAGLESTKKLNFVSISGVTPRVLSHSTMVTSLIVGKPVTMGNSITYEGVVPNATVYQCATATTTHVYNAFQKLVDLGVNVINYSAGFDTGLVYHSHDREIDRLIQSTGVTFVKSAGNSGGNITSPGKAYNAIVVGNAQTKSDHNVTMSSPYSMHSSSSYNEDAFLTNKPDIAAPGTEVCYSSSPTTLKIQTGTSCAAPLVTGVIAQMMQASPGLKQRPYDVKAKLMLGADRSKITGDSTAYGLLGDKSGAGFANAVNAVLISLLSRNNILTYNLSHDSFPATTKTVYLTRGQKLRAVLSFEKRETVSPGLRSYGNDLDLNIRDSSGRLVAFSSSASHNVEIAEYIVPSSGYYHMEVIVYKHIKAPQDTFLSASLAHWLY